MARGYNKCTFVGNVGRDPDLRYTDEGNAWVRFSIAVNEGDDNTIWISCVAFGKTAELIGEYVRTGKQLLIEGKLTGDKETGTPVVYKKNDGSYGSSHDVIVKEFLLLGNRADAEEAVSERESEFPF